MRDTGYQSCEITAYSYIIADLDKKVKYMAKKAFMSQKSSFNGLGVYPVRLPTLFNGVDFFLHSAILPKLSFSLHEDSEL